MKKFFILFTLILVISMIVTGCSRKTGDELMAELNEKVNASLQAKNYDAALSELNKAMKKQAYKAYLFPIHSTILKVKLDAGRYEEFLAGIAETVKMFPEDQTRSLFEQVFFFILERRPTEDTERLIKTIQEAAPDSESIIARAEVYKLHLLAKNNAWEQVVADFKPLTDKLDDRYLSLLLHKITERTRTNNRLDVADTLAEYVIDNHKSKQNSLKTAANIWLRTSMGKDDVSQAQQRLAALLEKEVPAQIVKSQFNQHCHRILGKGDETIINNMSEIGKKIIQQDESLEEGMKPIMLDIAFLANDYEETIRLVDSGMPGRDETWQKLALSKLRAHKALQDNKKEEAIKHFREFMMIFKEVGAQEVDPTTGIMHTVNMTLGLTEKRIGDVMKEMNNPEGANKAYKESRAYYLAALEETKSFPKSQEYIKQNLQEIEKENK